jgi:hypothetical protein
MLLWQSDERLSFCIELPKRTTRTFISELGAVPAKLVPRQAYDRPRSRGSAIGKIEMLDGFDDPLTDEKVEPFF